MRRRQPPASRPQGSRTPRLFERLASLFVAIVALVCHTGRLAHLLVVQHDLCEHGALSHHVDAKSSDDDAGDGDPASGTDDDHDHCSVASIPLRLEIAEPPVLEAEWIVLPPPDGRAAPEHRPLSPLDSAPKASPPRARASSVIAA